ncbi:MAG: alpha/beta hydrolase [Erysipelotrichia bacterium]|nr:alpha/beta hydrolase [Erysipelotrichia bacterium]
MSFLEQTSAVEIKDTRISLSEAGKGENVLFLHGNPGSRKDFSAIIEKIADAGIKLVAPDRPGHMSSDELIDENNDPWLDAEIYAQLIDQKCGGKAWLLGYSMGAFIACKIAVKYPEKVKGVIMLAPYLMPDNPSEKPSSLPELAKGALLGTILGIILPLLSQTRMQKHIENVFSPLAVPADFLETWLPRYTRFETLMAMMTDKNAMLTTLKEVHEGIKSLECPVVALIGDKDMVCSAEAQKKLIADTIPGAQIRILQDAGHSIPVTHAENCLVLIKEAIASSAAGS